jgi:hypothetical protein
MATSQFPGYGDKKHAPPLPPKYLEVQGADGKLETIENPARAKAESMKRSLRKIEKNPNMPKQIQLVQRGATPYIHADFTTAPPKKDYSAPAHRYRAAVDSNSDFKGASGNADRLRQQLESADYKHVMRNYQEVQDLNSIGTNIYADGKSDSARGPPVTGRSAPPQYVGSSYAHLPNAGKKGFLMHNRPPERPQVPRPYVPAAKHFFDAQKKLANRTTNGEILGKDQVSYVDADRVPYMEPGYVVTPQDADSGYERDMPTAENPVVAYDEEGIWSACWDDSAEAVYYYNNVTGEATWIPPEL